MALKLTNASSQYLAITSDVLSCNGDYSIAGWIRFSATDVKSILTIRCASSADHDALYTFANKIQLEVNAVTSPGGALCSTTLSTGVWYHLALVRNGATTTVYLDLASDGTYTDGGFGSRGASTGLELGRVFDSFYGDSRFWGWKAWSRSLTVTELTAESKQAMPVSALSLYGVWPFLAGATRAKDFSGKGHDWTETNSPTDEDPPSIRFRKPEPLLFWPPAAAGGTTVTPTTASLVITTFAPTVTVSANNTVTPTTAALVTSAFAPTVTVSSNNVCTPTTAALTTTGYAPTVTASNHQTAIPTTASLTLTTFAPTVTAGGNQTCTPTTAALVLTTFAPTVTAASANVCTPDTAALVITTYAPSVYTANTCTPDTVALTLTTYAPTVTVSGVNPVISYGEWDTTVLLTAGEEWIVTLTGASCDAPKARVAIRFRDAT